MSGRRRRLDERTWSELLRRFDASSQTVQGFCAREGLSPSSFYRWRERIQRFGVRRGARGVERTARPATVPAGQAAAPAAVTPAGFIDLGSLAASQCAPAAGLELRLDLGGGVVLHIVRH